MSDSKTSTAVEKVQLPATSTGDDVAYDDLAKASDYLLQLRLGQGMTKQVAQRKISIGDFFVPNGDDVQSYGQSVDILVFARRPKAVDATDSKAVVENYEYGSETFNTIKANASNKDMKCMFGIAFLAYCREFGGWLEYYAASKTARSEARKLFGYLPRTKADVEKDLVKAEAHGIDPDKVEGTRPPKPVTLFSDLIEKHGNSWYGAFVKNCSQPFQANEVPSEEEVAEQMRKFLSKPSSQVVAQEEVDASDTPER